MVAILLKSFTQQRADYSQKIMHTQLGQENFYSLIWPNHHFSRFAREKQAPKNIEQMFSGLAFKVAISIDLDDCYNLQVEGF